MHRIKAIACAHDELIPLSCRILPAAHRQETASVPVLLPIISSNATAEPVEIGTVNPKSPIGKAITKPTWISNHKRAFLCLRVDIQGGYKV